MDERSDTTKALLHPLLTTKPARQREFISRKDLFVLQSVHPADVPKFEADGWAVQREGSRKVRIKKPKNHDAVLEDQTWCLFYRMGYSDINGKNFKIRYTRQDGTQGEKQVDVFAKDDETVIVAECKARETRGRRPRLLQWPFREAGADNCQEVFLGQRTSGGKQIQHLRG
jgi:DNA sulfur modification protein DndB